MGAFKQKTILQVGTVFGDKFQIIRLVGKGGMGEVYEAVERPFGRQVAIKVISESTADDEDLLRRFKLEGKALSLVNHPNIVTVYETGQIDGINYISMEYVEGKTIHDISKTLIIPDNEFCMLFLQMCEGIRVLHAKNVIHRDIKPKNIIYQRENFIKILDFGIAKFYGEHTMHHTAVGVIVGTLLYMAPEVATGTKASYQSDIWSLGAIFYEMLTGKPLIQAKTTFEALNQLNTLKVKFPSSAKDSIRPEMQKIIKKMCAKDVAKRYQTVEEIIEDLQAYAAKYPATGRWQYQNICKNVTNLSEVKKRLRSDGFAVTQAKRILGEAIYDSQILMQEPPAELPQAGQDQTANTRIDEKTLQNAIARVTNPSAKRLDVTDSGRRSVSQQDATEIFKQTGEFLQETSHNVARWFSWLGRGKFNNRMEWGLLATAIIVLIVAAVIKNKDSIGRDPASENPTVEQPSNTQVLNPIEEPIEVKPPIEQPVVKPIERPNKPIYVVPTVEEPRPVNNDPVTVDPVVRPMKPAMRPPIVRQPMPMVRPMPMVNVARIEKKAPILVGANVNFEFELRSISSSTKDYSRFPRLNWNSVKGAAKYVVQIAADSKFSSLAAERIVKKVSSFDWKKAVAGSYFWRVQAIDRNGNRSQFSSAGRLKVMLARPQLQPKMQKVFRFKSGREMKSKKSEIDFRWAEVPRAWGYFIQMSRNPSFTSGVQETFRNSNQHRFISSQSGDYYFRVAAADARKKRVSEYSRPMKMSLRRLLDVEKPKILTPRNGDKILMPKGDSDFIIVLSWTKIKQTQRYILQVAKDENFNEIVLARSSKNVRYTLSRELDQGKFYWRVKSSQKGQDSPWSETGSFFIKK